MYTYTYTSWSCLVPVQISMTTGAVPRYDDQKNLQAVVGDQRKFR